MLFVEPALIPVSLPLRRFEALSELGKALPEVFRALSVQGFEALFLFQERLFEDSRFLPVVVGRFPVVPESSEIIAAVNNPSSTIQAMSSEFPQTDLGATQSGNQTSGG
ncbi:MAG: hypothetical protein HQM12_22625, partial [SAR324 cluster bacterium]|nr:hypothetical protein [SAR324 cluster bacterium]